MREEQLHIEDLVRQKQDAITREDFEAADALKSEIEAAVATLKKKEQSKVSMARDGEAEENAMREEKSRIEILMQQKQEAINRDDFDTARALNTMFAAADVTLKKKETREGSMARDREADEKAVREEKSRIEGLMQQKQEAVVREDFFWRLVP